VSILELDSQCASGCNSGLFSMRVRCGSSASSGAGPVRVRTHIGNKPESQPDPQRTRNVRPDSQEYTCSWTRNRTRRPRIRGSICSVGCTYLGLVGELSRKILHIHLNQLGLVAIGLWLLSLHGTFKLIGIEPAPHLV
jgi:hypothetical protein